METRNDPLLLVECAQAYCKLASLSEKHSNFAQAIAVLEGAIPKCCNDSSITDEANIQEHCTVVLYGTLGRLKEIAGDYEGAVVNLRQALPACQVLHGPDHPQTQELAYLLEMAESVL